jgi:surface antigen
MALREMIGPLQMSRIARILRSPVVVSVIGVLLLSACSTTSARNALPASLFGQSSSTNSTVYLSALNGGIVSRTGVNLGRSDLNRALTAEYRALETSPAGQEVAWGEGRLRGTVVANAPYQVGNENCRQYSHVLNVEGREIRARGAACRNAGGAWSPLG